MLKAVTRQAAHVDARVRSINAGREASGERAISTAYFFDHFADEAEDLSVLVTEEDFIGAQKELVPSVSAGELAHYEKVRNSFEGERGGENGKEGKGKGKAVAVDKGKGKARAEDSDEEVVGAVNGRAKGKGKAVFRDGASDDEGLY